MSGHNNPTRARRARDLTTATLTAKDLAVLDTLRRRATQKHFPSLCPVGSEEEAVELSVMNDGRWLCWPIGNDHFLRVTIYEGGERYYHIADRKETQEAFLNNYTVDDIRTVEPEDRKRLRKMKLTRILRLVDKANTP